MRLSSQQGFSLAAVFLLISVNAGWMTLIRTAFQATELSNNEFGVVMLCAISALIFGLVSGTRLPSRIGGMLLSGLVGTATGAAIGFMIVRPAPPGIVAAACGLILAAGAVFRKAPQLEPEDVSPA